MSRKHFLLPLKANLNAFGGRFKTHSLSISFFLISLLPNEQLMKKIKFESGN